MKYLTTDGEWLPIEWKTPYNHDTLAESDRTAVNHMEPTMTVQAPADETDINVIFEKYTKTGLAPGAAMPPTSMDFADIFDFHSAMDTINAAQQAFMELPAKIRARFGNDAGEFVAFVDDALEKGNLQELRDMGLAPPGKPQEPTSASGDPSPAPAPPKTPS